MLLLLSQAVRYLIDPTVDHHDKQLLKRELSSELVSLLVGAGVPAVFIVNDFSVLIIIIS